MDFNIERDEIRREIRFNGTIRLNELAALRLDELEKRVLDMPAEKASDHLMNLEVIYRRHEEQQEQK